MTTTTPPQSQLTEIPPGLSPLPITLPPDSHIKPFTNGPANPVEYAGSPWRELPVLVKKYTTTIIVQGMKKRGWGIGKYNGFGGKVEPNESSLDAAKRELHEEAGVTIPPTPGSITHAGTLLFLTSSVEWAFHIDIYRVDKFEGEITESDEMKPEWFSINPEPSVSNGLPPIPYDKMWETDRCWLPLLLSNKKFVGRADFVGEKDQSRAHKWWYGIVDLDS
ncbi:nudix-type domain-containing protein 1 isoform p22 [Coprinopsis cinerea okayama7|uniref:Oxidized purine nucleoside triphosphate hydrolase n=1 Tax=Coprinopsis cinerea (strain Okayama-7 / 130 / ATCC MYA-4618 / FGSC 9003) TaxID=240176 RepID=A8P5P0_COPC7|nr:nudix-type domain-containing protein 1 isoform p22 [Coprinopsis cinerea okayama7\|eukprot:XP_001838991.2 nudix-type domain-containing protein 1 isoform p22 [Coprinopsis cinerea okayama7\